MLAPLPSFTVHGRPQSGWIVVDLAPVRSALLSDAATRRKRTRTTAPSRRRD